MSSYIPSFGGQPNINHDQWAAQTNTGPKLSRGDDSAHSPSLGYMSSAQSIPHLSIQHYLAPHTSAPGYPPTSTAGNVGTSHADSLSPQVSSLQPPTATKTASPPPQLPPKVGAQIGPSQTHHSMMRSANMPGGYGGRTGHTPSTMNPIAHTLAQPQVNHLHASLSPPTTASIPQMVDHPGPSLSRPGSAVATTMVVGHSDHSQSSSATMSIPSTMHQPPGNIPSVHHRGANQTMYGPALIFPNILIPAVRPTSVGQSGSTATPSKPVYGVPGAHAGQPTGAIPPQSSGYPPHDKRSTQPPPPHQFPYRGQSASSVSSAHTHPSTGPNQPPHQQTHHAHGPSHGHGQLITGMGQHGPFQYTTHLQPDGATGHLGTSAPHHPPSSVSATAGHTMAGMHVHSQSQPMYTGVSSKTSSDIYGSTEYSHPPHAQPSSSALVTSPQNHHIPTKPSGRKRGRPRKTDKPLEPEPEIIMSAPHRELRTSTRTQSLGDSYSQPLLPPQRLTKRQLRIHQQKMGQFIEEIVDRKYSTELGVSFDSYAMTIPDEADPAAGANGIPQMSPAAASVAHHQGMAGGDHHNPETSLSQPSMNDSAAVLHSTGFTSSVPAGESAAAEGVSTAAPQAVDHSHSTGVSDPHSAQQDMPPSQELARTSTMVQDETLHGQHVPSEPNVDLDGFLSLDLTLPKKRGRKSYQDLAQLLELERQRNRSLIQQLESLDASHLSYDDEIDGPICYDLRFDYDALPPDATTITSESTSNKTPLHKKTICLPPIYRSKPPPYVRFTYFNTLFQCTLCSVSYNGGKSSHPRTFCSRQQAVEHFDTEHAGVARRLFSKVIECCAHPDEKLNYTSILEHLDNYHTMLQCTMCYGLFDDLALFKKHAASCSKSYQILNIIKNPIPPSPEELNARKLKKNEKISLRPVGYDAQEPAVPKPIITPPPLPPPQPQQEEQEQPSSDQPQEEPPQAEEQHKSPEQRDEEHMNDDTSPINEDESQSSMSDSMSSLPSPADLQQESPQPQQDDDDDNQVTPIHPVQSPTPPDSPSPSSGLSSPSSSQLTSTVSSPSASHGEFGATRTLVQTELEPSATPNAENPMQSSLSPSLHPINSHHSHQQQGVLQPLSQENVHQQQLTMQMNSNNTPTINSPAPTITHQIPFSAPASASNTLDNHSHAIQPPSGPSTTMPMGNVSHTIDPHGPAPTHSISSENRSVSAPFSSSSSQPNSMPPPLQETMRMATYSSANVPPTLSPQVSPQPQSHMSSSYTFSLDPTASSSQSHLGSPIPAIPGYALPGAAAHAQLLPYGAPDPSSLPPLPSE